MLYVRGCGTPVLGSFMFARTATVCEHLATTVARSSKRSTACRGGPGTYRGTLPVTLPLLRVNRLGHCMDESSEGAHMDGVADPHFSQNLADAGTCLSQVGYGRPVPRLGDSSLALALVSWLRRRTCAGRAYHWQSPMSMRKADTWRSPTVTNKGRQGKKTPKMWCF